MPQADPRQARMDVALDWLLRTRQAPDDARLQAAFSAWQAADPENPEALRKAERIWRLTGQLAPSTTAKWPVVPPSVAAPVTPAASPPSRPRRRRALGWAIGSALAACLVLGLGPRLNLALQADYQTAQNERRELQLPDGSQVVLDSGSAIAVDFSETRRDVRLLSGQAFFEVKPDPSKPFHVQAQELEVAVTGTAFNVDLASRSIAVAVLHGSVKVSRGASQQLLSPGLTLGQQLQFDRTSGQALIQNLPPQRMTAWRNGQLVADNARLGDMVDQLRRYLPGTVVLRDPQLADRRITGVYDIANPQAALRAMVQPYGGRLESWTPYLLLLSKAQ